MCCLGLSMVAQEQAGQLLPFDFLDFPLGKGDPLVTLFLSVDDKTFAYADTTTKTPIR